MAKAQQDQQAFYICPVQAREFSPGGRVLVLVPTAECKFLATWKSPMRLIEVGEVNYKVRQPGRGPPVQIYHVNMLKKWHASDVF